MSSTQQPDLRDAVKRVKAIEDGIVEVAKAMRVLETSRIKRDTIVALIADNSKLSKKAIHLVLNNLVELEARYLKPKKEEK